MSLVSEMISNKLQIALAGSVKSYIALARLSRKLATAFIILQGLFLGMSLGILLIVMAGLFSDLNSFRSEWTLFIGLSLVTTSAIGLFVWNSEAAWARRLKISEAIDRVMRPAGLDTRLEK